MVHLPALITDLALILIIAGTSTLIFKKLKQPLVLGYLVAGFLAGPHSLLLPTVSDLANINIWAEIGVIFLIFALGLEFGFRKITSVGHPAFVTATTEVLTMLAVGYTAAQFMGWNHMDSLFLGGMLSMSSTTIIIKAFADLNIKGQRFTDLVFGALIVEDIAGIVMMVMIATLAASSTLSQWGLLECVLKLGFFLVLWFVMGIFIVPQFLRKYKKDLNNETLLIVSLGLCLGMVVFANKVGLSTVLGAFIAGSILADTHEAERIEHLLLPVKDLFGAVFFVSVGMLVNPGQLAEYALPIAVVTFSTIAGKLVFSTTGFLLSGESLRVAMQGGFSLAQIGEFSFIIAGLGQSLGVTSGFLYPIVVSVSVITTFTTPFFVGLAAPCYQRLDKALPDSFKTLLERYTADGPAGKKRDKNWQVFLRGYFSQVLVNTVLLSAISLLALTYGGLIQDYLPGPPGYALETVLPLLVMSPFLKALLFNKHSRPELAAILWFERRANRPPLLFLHLLRVFLAIAFIFVILFKFLPLPPLLIVALALAVAFAIHSSDWLLGQYLRIEARFLINLNEKQLLAQKEAAAKNNGGQSEIHWLDEELRIAFLKVRAASSCISKRLQDLALREKFGVNILQAARKDHIYDMPGGGFTLKESDLLIALGSAAQLRVFCAGEIKGLMGFDETGEQISLRAFVMNQDATGEDSPLLYCAVIIDEKSPLLGKSIKDSRLREQLHCLVLGLERGFYSTINPHISLIFEKGDIIWVLGKSGMVAELAKKDLLRVNNI